LSLQQSVFWLQGIAVATHPPHCPPLLHVPLQQSLSYMHPKSPSPRHAQVRPAQKPLQQSES
jgi:hypothetical protein